MSGPILWQCSYSKGMYNVHVWRTKVTLEGTYVLLHTTKSGTRPTWGTFLTVTIAMSIAWTMLQVDKMIFSGIILILSTLSIKDWLGIRDSIQSEFLDEINCH